ncbi:MAG: phosphoglucosamine mutase [candidate division Zixibacteria bacterium]|nr:phosphoglucosamine mutase [candidate division Zixibacteria bacterium]
MAKPELVQSTSGIRGVIGNGLEPIMITTYGCAFGTFLKKGVVVVGRDSRPSGEMVKAAVISGLVSVGIDVVDIGVVPTPTVEIAVKQLKANGGICVTASHNPAQWNALKFFNKRGEFITAEEYSQLQVIYTSKDFAYKAYNRIGRISHQSHWIDSHITKTLALTVLNKVAIKKRRFKVVVDAINGAGSHALPTFLHALGAKVIKINCKGDGDFVHLPEPIPKNLKGLADAVKQHKADIGMACDPDADRLVLVNEAGQTISEELTLTIAVLEVLKKRRGPTVINLSTSKTTADVARSCGSRVYYSKVGESNVVQMLREKRGVIGGEGNGGVIFPEFHSGRDCLVAAGLILSALASSGKTLSALVETFPRYYTIKTKFTLPDDFDQKLVRFETESEKLVGKAEIDRRDGLRFDFPDGWVQLRKSNTEPIYRVIVETNQQKLTGELVERVGQFFKQM